MAERPDQTASPGSSGPVDFSIPHRDAPVYVISVAAELSGMHPQTLRGYDRMGLVSPGRTVGGGRRYSWHDIEQLREVARLTAQGIGLEGVRQVLQLQNEVAGLREQVLELQTALERAHAAMRDRRLPAVAPPRSAAMVRWRRPTR
jgi:MerR family transcriptional regulator, heat shock protein HspR